MEIFEENIKEGQDFDKTLKESSLDELKELKAWLFKENIRIETEKSDLKHLKENFQKEKQQFLSEINEINRKIDMEQKRLKQDEIFFEKKMDILKNGFVQLDAERKQFEKEKMNFDARKEAHESYMKQEKNIDTAKLLFQGVKSQLALKKRYRDLLKMFHPDNIAGDHEMVILINSVYEELKTEYEMGKQAQ